MVQEAKQRLALQHSIHPIKLGQLLAVRFIPSCGTV